MSDKDIQLSRRKVLAGLGTIGIASAGAGLGTTAWLSDQESFLNNVLTAGTLDLIVDYEYSVDQDGVGPSDTGDTPVTGVNNGGEGEAAGGEAISFVIDDMKPGDTGTFEFCFRIYDNPAYLWACGGVTANNENGYTEPEMAVDDTPDVGELADAIDATAYYCDGDGTNLGEIASGTLASVVGALNGGLALDGDTEVDGRQPFQPGDEAGNPCICIDWSIDGPSVGNEIQGDSLAFDLVFHAVQSRHNDGSANPCAECDVVSGSGWGKSTVFEDGVETSFARGRFGDNLASGAWEVALAEPGLPPTIDEANYVWTPGATVPFSYTYDGSTATFTLDGTTVSGAIPTPRGKVGIQLKADEANISVGNLELKNAGGSTVASGQALGISDDDTDGRGLQYLIYGENCVNAAEGFTLEGEVTVDINEGFGGGDEDVAFDVIVE